MGTDGYMDLDQIKYDEWLASQSTEDLCRLAKNLKALCDQRWLAPERGSINKHSTDYDPIAASMSRHPKLTAEAAERMACAFGFGP